MTQRDAVDVAADVLFDEMAMIADDATCVNMIAEALRSASNSGAEAMREAAAALARDFSWTLPMWAAGVSPNEASDDAAEMVKDQIADALLALPLPAPGAPASPWQGMESAPKTGERILATGGGLGRQVEVVTWNERIGCWNAETCTLEDHDSDPDGYNRPTLWQPLPAPPVNKDT